MSTTFDAPVERVGLAEVPMPYAESLERTALTHDATIAAGARQPAA